MTIGSRRRELECALWGLGLRVGVHPPVHSPSFESYPLSLADYNAAKINSSLGEVAGNLGLTSIRGTWAQDGRYCIELPKTQRDNVQFSDCYPRVQKGTLPVLIGLDAQHNVVSADVAKMPHLFLAGSTGSGKSVFLHGLLSSLISTRPPSELRLVLSDCKQVELSVYNGIPHMLTDCLVDDATLIPVLESLCTEMDRRFGELSAARCSNLEQYNQRVQDNRKIPYIVVVIDELSDVMAMNKKTLEPLLIRLAQKARAAGIHLILATQRPSKESMSVALKNNLNTRVCFSVVDNASSRSILDVGGAEALLGQGDGLYRASGSRALVRFQGAFIDSQELEQILHRASQMKPSSYAVKGITNGDDDASESDDSLEPIDRAIKLAESLEWVNSSTLLKAGVCSSGTAARLLLQELRSRGVIGENDPSRKASQVLKNPSDADGLLIDPDAFLMDSDASLTGSDTSDTLARNHARRLN